MRSISQVVAEMREHAKDGVIQVKEFKESGGIVVGCYCTYMPWEIVNASGAVSVSLCSKNDAAIPAAEEHLPRNLCPLIKASYGHALRGSCPYFHFCDVVVGETTCDGKRKMYELMQGIKKVYMIDLPHQADRPQDFELLRREYEAFRKFIGELTGKPITDDALRASIALRNRERRALREMWNLSTCDDPALTGREVQEFGDYMQTHFHKEEAVNWLENCVKEIQTAWENGDRRGLTGPRVLVTGCPIGGAMKVVDAIEAAGGVVVCYENCGGEKELGYLVDETGDPMDAITRKYLSIGCSIMSPNCNRMDALKYLMDRYRVAGVVDVTLTSCHTYAVETWSVRQVVQSSGRGYLAVETDYSASDKEQLSTRLGAFVEMLESAS
ncbi:Benzoyl-CoA reductase/2-hydroxyglutaryl-CoA dehydratase subunit, BcrC/BadD/HgdB [Jonquetella anthropi DSM 22815]|uniref:Benzoyl-CoA reductase/2-hydroxyglutaryl-CoA dehydratase subunit, BcrC/BadD/HgdB n=1 Tax=Jonquetella anthropi DSM 22815 TaxID=885272 RepID=H0UJ55_9BACT|nr:double-cubane-cluster-containing anaerobic reductase [Jonquetella anthropi]EEX48765.1 2-hydroxyglutaryl-CoA dehydratase, D-component [Jonquetella anthropi E3_33 E1]EHM12788.1 Benzoyl-CoA reductase/2-hydroxyglutaryl-CoA dehydratase subunit, BcrC/BadD/HgdB [Jonquetella anthropi DSM 22815]